MQEYLSGKFLLRVSGLAADAPRRQLGCAMRALHSLVINVFPHPAGAECEAAVTKGQRLLARQFDQALGQHKSLVLNAG
jgi:hypothetical protein